MPFRYQEFKIVDEETQHLIVGWEAQEYNRNILKQGVVVDGKSVPLRYLRNATLHEERTYREFIPPFYTLGRVEEYENDALNIFVRDTFGHPIGVITVRPL